MLFLIYALPAIWSAFLSKELKCLDRNRSALGMKIFSFLLFFTFITLSVRQFFRGSILFLGQATNVEIYTYSAAWLLFGIVLLIIGIIKQDKMIRFASLCVMMLAVLKVFLFDVSELQDLYRVFSFFGLGLCLIGLSYFYARFVFRSVEKKEC